MVDYGFHYVFYAPNEFLLGFFMAFQSELLILAVSVLIGFAVRTSLSKSKFAGSKQNINLMTIALTLGSFFILYISHLTGHEVLYFLYAYLGLFVMTALGVVAYQFFYKGLPKPWNGIATAMMLGLIAMLGFFLGQTHGALLFMGLIVFIIYRSFKWGLGISNKELSGAVDRLTGSGNDFTKKALKSEEVLDDSIDETEESIEESVGSKIDLKKAKTKDFKELVKKIVDESVVAGEAPKGLITFFSAFEKVYLAQLWRLIKRQLLINTAKFVESEVPKGISAEKRILKRLGELWDSDSITVLDKPEVASVLDNYLKDNYKIRFEELHEAVILLNTELSGDLNSYATKFYEVIRLLDALFVSRESLTKACADDEVKKILKESQKELEDTATSLLTDSYTLYYKAVTKPEKEKETVIADLGFNDKFNYAQEFKWSEAGRCGHSSTLMVLYKFWNKIKIRSKSFDDFIEYVYSKIKNEEVSEVSGQYNKRELAILYLHWFNYLISYLNTLKSLELRLSQKAEGKKTVREGLSTVNVDDALSININNIKSYDKLAKTFGKDSFDKVTFKDFFEKVNANDKIKELIIDRSGYLHPDVIIKVLSLFGFESEVLHKRDIDKVIEKAKGGAGLIIQSGRHFSVVNKIMKNVAGEIYFECADPAGSYSNYLLKNFGTNKIFDSSVEDAINVFTLTGLSDEAKYFWNVFEKTDLKKEIKESFEKIEEQLSKIEPAVEEAKEMEEKIKELEKELQKTTAEEEKIEGLKNRIYNLSTEKEWKELYKEVSKLEPDDQIGLSLLLFNKAAITNLKLELKDKKFLKFKTFEEKDKIGFILRRLFNQEETIKRRVIGPFKKDIITKKEGSILYLSYKRKRSPRDDHTKFFNFTDNMKHLKKKNEKTRIDILEKTIKLLEHLSWDKDFKIGEKGLYIRFKK